MEPSHRTADGRFRRLVRLPYSQASTTTRFCEFHSGNIGLSLMFLSRRSSSQAATSRGVMAVVRPSPSLASGSASGPSSPFLFRVVSVPVRGEILCEFVREGLPSSSRSSALFQRPRCSERSMARLRDLPWRALRPLRYWYVTEREDSRLPPHSDHRWPRSSALLSPPATRESPR